MLKTDPPTDKTVPISFYPKLKNIHFIEVVLVFVYVSSTSITNCKMEEGGRSNMRTKENG